jgi:hypothetical protein
VIAEVCEGYSLIARICNQLQLLQSLAYENGFHDYNSRIISDSIPSLYVSQLGKRLQENRHD